MGFMDELKKIIHPYDDEDYDYEDDFEEPSRDSRSPFDDRKEDRRIGGTPSNDPALLGEYMDRIRGMYFRSRNHPSVAGFALGSDSGNGYNMYKAYQWLKEAEPQRFVIYLDADGEWNTDL